VPCRNDISLELMLLSIFYLLLLLVIVSVQVRLHLLSAVMKCFFKRPPETQKALGAALAAGLADSHQVQRPILLLTTEKIYLKFLSSMFLLIGR